MWLAAEIYPLKTHTRLVRVVWVKETWECKRPQQLDMKNVRPTLSFLSLTSLAQRHASHNSYTPELEPKISVEQHSLYHRRWHSNHEIKSWLSEQPTTPAVKLSLLLFICWSSSICWKMASISWVTSMSLKFRCKYPGYVTPFTHSTNIFAHFWRKPQFCQ